MAWVLPFYINQSTVEYILVMKLFTKVKKIKLNHLVVSDQPDTIATHFPRGLDNPDAAWTPLHLTTSLMRLYSQKDQSLMDWL